ncbi:DEHA2G05764p [Debaryomyces hansenii CBS767]|jgi:phosphoribosylglycinamide formyltransferase|uniref:Phosphoribosylglycinamide formyltransferase n=1 Tax=Debaryomyces hansenii (strain ATCC 36239 / CBS 767 / BCRC 21394 / JCM 1990 / NBRC 0083 / IGC 2968) TaxID=284592 RepID=B5RV39_DEBHA|nr:DEHA2G05764p [Debaryomyces hansenii CBS767]CAR65918.1 DEHA2G05764p [Debaryomyces hansenii CBS767]|eukprot:XP_002770583.1 DEHA2G05764p [Debaryomyces hansenii CBS767]
MPDITVLISGSGSNLQALIDAEKKGELGGTITQVVSSSDTAYGLTRASQASIGTKTHILKNYYKGTTKEDKSEREARREKFNEDLAKLLINGDIRDTPVDGYTKPDLVVCAGWMLILSPTVLTPLEKTGITIINLHPALPGAFDGTHAIERAWKAGQSGDITTGGVMIHKVIAEVDRGAPVLVKEIDLRKDESLDDYETRIHDLEHVAIVEGTNIVLKELAK